MFGHGAEAQKIHQQNRGLAKHTSTRNFRNRGHHSYENNRKKDQGPQPLQFGSNSPGHKRARRLEALVVIGIIVALGVLWVLFTFLFW